MQLKYFSDCRTLEELKKSYWKLSKMHHPDHGGNTATMQDINAEHDYLYNRLKASQNASADEHHQNTEAPEEFRAICELLLKLDGLNVELCGSWLWISGETKKHKDALKAAGCKWASKKHMWSWHHEEDGRSYYRGKKTMDEIRVKYGSEYITGTAPRRQAISG